MTCATHCPDCARCHETWLEELSSWEDAMASGKGGATNDNKPEYDITYHRTCQFHFEEAVALEKEDAYCSSIHDSETYEEPYDPKSYSALIDPEDDK